MTRGAMMRILVLSVFNCDIMLVVHSLEKVKQLCKTDLNDDILLDIISRELSV